MSVPASLPLLNINSASYPYSTAGIVQLISGGAFISANLVGLNSKIFLSYYSVNNPGRLYVAAISPGQSFTIGSTNPNDNGLVSWFMITESSGQSGPILPAFYGYPVLANTGNAKTYGVATLINGTVFVPCTYIDVNIPIILSVQVKSAAAGNPFYYISGIVPGSGFNINSTVPFDNAVIGYWVLYSTYWTSPSNNLTVGCSWLDVNSASKNYGKGQFSVGGLPVEIPTTRAAFNVIVFSSIMQTPVNRQNISLPYLFGINDGVSLSIQTIDSFFNDTSQFAWMILLNTKTP